MADTIEIVQGTATTVEVAGPTGPQGPAGAAGATGAQGPQGVPGTGLEVLTTQGDLLYQGASTGQRLAIGTSNQVLKVVGGIPAWGAESGAVTSVNTLSGAVVLEAADVDAAADVVPAAYVLASTDPAYAPISGYYYRSDTAVNGKAAYYKIGSRENTSITYSSATTEWQIKHNATIVWVSNDNPVPNDPWDVADWQSIGSDPFLTVSQADTVLFLNATAQKASGVTTASDISAVPTSRTITAGTGLNGGGDLTANRTLAVSYGSSAGTACEGNDARLSDDRDPNAHAASHLAGGADEIFDQSLNTTDSPTFAGLTAESWQSGSGQVLVQFDDNIFKVTNEDELSFEVQAGELRLRDFANNFKGTFLASSQLSADQTYSLPDASGVLALTDDLPTAASDIGAAASGSITTSGLTQSTARLIGRTSSGTGAPEEIQIGSGLSLSSGELSATGGSGVTAVGTTLADILSVSGSDLVADDLAADKLYGWDDSESKAIGFVIGSGLSVSGDTLSATASGGSKTYAVFTATDNQPTATAFATLDTRNSIAVLDFDDASTESAVFVGIMPEAASLGSGLIVSLRWMATTATSGDVRWSVAWEKSNTDLDSDSYDSATAATSTTNGTSGIVTVTNITCTTIDSLAAGDLFRLRVQRLGGDGADTTTGDAELVAVEIRSAA